MHFLALNKNVCIHYRESGYFFLTLLSDLETMQCMHNQTEVVQEHGKVCRETEELDIFFFLWWISFSFSLTLRITCKVAYKIRFCLKTQCNLISLVCPYTVVSSNKLPKVLNFMFVCKKGYCSKMNPQFVISKPVQVFVKFSFYCFPINTVE